MVFGFDFERLMKDWVNNKLTLDKPLSPDLL
jgi:hypothetical protein